MNKVRRGGWFILGYLALMLAPKTFHLEMVASGEACAPGLGATAPPPPSDLGGTAHLGSIQWFWQASSGGAQATEYHLHDDGSDTLVATIQATGSSSEGYLERGLSENTQYSRHVHAANECCESGASNTYQLFTLVHDPTKADFVLSAVSESEMSITVTEPPNATAGQTGVEINRSDGATISPFSPAYSAPDTGLDENTQYSYSITFRNGDGQVTATSSFNSRYTLVHAASTGDFHVTAISDSEIQITVSPPPNETADLTGVEITKVDRGTIPFSQDYAPKDSGLEPETTYSYAIRFRNGDGVESGSQSGALPATTQARPESISITSLNVMIKGEKTGKIAVKGDGVVSPKGRRTVRFILTFTFTDGAGAALANDVVPMVAESTVAGTFLLDTTFSETLTNLQRALEPPRTPPPPPNPSPVGPPPQTPDLSRKVGGVACRWKVILVKTDGTDGATDTKEARFGNIKPRDPVATNGGLKVAIANLKATLTGLATSAKCVVTAESAQETQVAKGPFTIEIEFTFTFTNAKGENLSPAATYSEVVSKPGAHGKLSYPTPSSPGLMAPASTAEAKVVATARVTDSSSPPKSGSASN